MLATFALTAGRARSYGKPVWVRSVLGFSTAACCVVIAGCNGEDGTPNDGGAGACVEPLPIDCEPLFEPASFALIYDQIVESNCSAGTGSSCHAEAGAQAGLVLANAERAYDELLGRNGGRALVLPGDPECSVLIQRLESPDASFRMPRGREPLDDRERCVIRQWIAQGAEGP